MSNLKNNRFDTSLEALTPEGVMFVLTPAGLPARTLAYAIDKMLQWSILLAIGIAGVFLSYSIGNWFFLIISFLIDWFYHVFFELAFRGQSPGKRIAGIRVVRNDGAPVDAGSSFIRNLLRFADTFLFLYLIAFISITASRGFKRLGDWAGGTLVVYTQTAPLSTINTAEFLSKYEPISPPFPLSPEEKQAILSFARRYPLLGESRANEIASIYTPYLRESNSSQSDSAFLLGIARSLTSKAVL